MNTSIPYARLSSFYFIYFAALGVFVPYWTVYLADVKGFSALQIGEIMALFMGTKVLAPLVWGWLVDHHGQRLRWIQLASFLTILCFALVYQATSFLDYLLLVAGFGFFWNAPLPQFEALTLNHLGLHVKRYSAIRLWGSIGFILAVISLPLLINRYGLTVVLHVQLLLFIAIFYGGDVCRTLVANGAIPLIPGLWLVPGLMLMGLLMLVARDFSLLQKFSR